MLVAYWYTEYMGNDTATFKDSLAVFFTKLNILLPQDPIIPLFGIHPDELKTYVQTKLSIQMFIKKIAQTCNQPRCSSTDECINKEWYFHSMGYSVI